MKPFLHSVVVAALVAAAAPAAAQQPRPERPYRGLFGGGVGDAEQLLTLNASAGGGYDDNVLAGSNGSAIGPGATSPDPRQARRGSFGQLGGSLSYSLNRDRVSVGASAATSSRYFASLPAKLASTYSGSAGASMQVARGTRVQGSLAVTHRPFLSLQLFPSVFDPGLGEPVLGSFDTAVHRDDYFTYSTSAAITQNVSRRGAVSLRYARRLQDFAGSARDLDSWSGGGQLTLGVARGLGLRFGYGYTEGQYALVAGGRSVQGRTIDAGVDFNRALSFSRRTTLSFSTGSSAIVDRSRTYYRLVGNARLNREIGRTWNASLAYDRNVGFLETFADPFFSDSATLAIGGLVNRRLQFHAAASASAGDVGLTGASRGFNTAVGQTGVNVGITRNLGLVLDYALYRYSFQSGAPLPADFQREMSRQSLTASLSVWAPLVHRARRPHASR